MRSQDRVLGKLKARAQGKNGREGFSEKFGGQPKINFETSSPCLGLAITMISRLI